MGDSDLSASSCVPCRGGIPALEPPRARELLDRVPTWELSPPADRLARSFQFRDFVEAMAFVNRVAAVAEAEGHHPDIEIHWNTVRLVLWTHKIGGLHENDFIMAAKIDTL